MKVGTTNWEQGKIRAGFTVLEVLAALVILGVLAFFVSGRLGNIGADVVAEQAIMRSHLRFAQALAIANNTAQWSVFLDAGSYTLRRDGQPAPINLPDESSPTRLLDPGVTVVSGGGEVSFNQYGAPAQDVTITLSDGNVNRNVRILGFTGLIP